MPDQSTQLVQKLWNYCNILRDDGLSYGDYVEQLTFLLFLKMADEQSRPPFNKPSPIPKGFDWASLLAKDGDELETHYRHCSRRSASDKGMLGVIFRKAQNKIQDPAKLRRLIVDLIDKEQWSSLSADVKGDAYEGLLQKNAEDVKGGRGPVLHAAPLDRGHCRRDASRARDDDLRSSVRHRRVPAGRARLSCPIRSTTNSIATRRKSWLAIRCTASNWWTVWPGCAA